MKSNEHDRLNFMLERDGLEATLEFATRVHTTYRKSLLKKNNHLSVDLFRRSTIESVLVLRQFLRQHKISILCR